MSLYGAMLSGVAGLTANSTSLSVTSSNISNSNTIGYKESDTSFASLMAGSQGAASVTSVSATSTKEVDTQGELESADSTTDLAISGDGFFIVNDSDGDTLYTRAGDFSTDENNDLVNSAGLYLQGYEITTATDGSESTSTTLSNISLDETAGINEASTSITLSGNLESTDDVNTTVDSTDDDITDANYSKTVNFYDSQGGVQTLTVSFYKTDTANEWEYSITSTSSDITGDDTGDTRTSLDNGTITFNSDGTLASVSSSNGTVDTSTDDTAGTVSLDVAFDGTSGLATPQTISFDFGTVGETDGFTQYASDYTAASTTDGAAYGTISSYSISEDGTVTATYSNSLTRDLYQIPLAIFANSDGLTSVSGTSYKTSDASGDPTIVTAGSAGSGNIESSYLESSTVDLATELTDLISTQRAYSACAKIVSTTTNMLDVLVNLGS